MHKHDLEKRKANAAQPRPPYSTTLEGQLQCELNEACVRRVVLKVARQGNLTTLRRIVVDTGRGSSIVVVAGGISVRRSVEQIENVGAELQRYRFVDAEVLKQGKVDPLVAWAVDLVANSA